MATETAQQWRGAASCPLLLINSYFHKLCLD